MGSDLLYIVLVVGSASVIVGVGLLLVRGEEEKKRPSDQRSWIGRFFG